MNGILEFPPPEAEEPLPLLLPTEDNEPTESLFGELRSIAILLDVLGATDQMADAIAAGEEEERKSRCGRDQAAAPPTREKENRFLDGREGG